MLAWERPPRSATDRGTASQRKAGGRDFFFLCFSVLCSVCRDIGTYSRNHDQVIEHCFGEVAAEQMLL